MCANTAGKPADQRMTLSCTYTAPANSTCNDSGMSRDLLFDSVQYVHKKVLGRYPQLLELVAKGIAAVTKPPANNSCALLQIPPG